MKARPTLKKPNYAKQELEIADRIVAAMAGQSSTISENRKLASLVKSFSWISLSEISHSILSDLTGYFGRIIMYEMGEPYPRHPKIAEWHAQTAKLTTIVKSSNNFMTREAIEEMIITYSPILKLTS